MHSIFDERSTANRWVISRAARGALLFTTVGHSRKGGKLSRIFDTHSIAHKHPQIQPNILIAHLRFNNRFQCSISLNAWHYQAPVPCAKKTLTLRQEGVHAWQKSAIQLAAKGKRQPACLGLFLSNFGVVVQSIYMMLAPTKTTRIKSLFIRGIT